MSEKRDGRFDKYAADQGDFALGDVEEVIEARKPRDGEIFRVDSRPDYRRKIWLYQERDSKSFTAGWRPIATSHVARLARFLPKDVMPFMIYHVCNEQGQRYLNPVPSIDEGGRRAQIKYYTTMHRAMKLGMDGRVIISTQDGYYQIIWNLKDGTDFDPKWEASPTLSEMLDYVWPAERCIDSLNDPIFKRFEGEIVS